jgi:hypothetical protein
MIKGPKVALGHTVAIPKVCLLPTSYLITKDRSYSAFRSNLLFCSTRRELRTPKTEGCVVLTSAAAALASTLRSTTPLSLHPCASPFSGPSLSGQGISQDPYVRPNPCSRPDLTPKMGFDGGRGGRGGGGRGGRGGGGFRGRGGGFRGRGSGFRGGGGGGGPPEGPIDELKLYVGGLSWGVDDAGLQEYLSMCVL